jgi:hypothetical protein
VISQIAHFNDIVFWAKMMYLHRIVSGLAIKKADLGDTFITHEMA